MNERSSRPGRIISPDDEQLGELCEKLTALSPSLDKPGAWPQQQLQLCAQYGVFEWFVGREYGGQDWDASAIMRAYLKLSAACLTTTFVITQRTGACQRIALSEDTELKRRLLPDLACGRQFATVGISHLTTSRRHEARPVLRAEEVPTGFMLDGFSPWVTGVTFADVVVVGATLQDHRQLLLALPTTLPGVMSVESADLVGLTASRTGPLRCENVHVPGDFLLAGPVAEVMKTGAGAKTGGVQTSILALGLAASALDYLDAEALKRPELEPPTMALRREWQSLCDELFAHLDGSHDCDYQIMRTRANSHVLRATQAGLAAAKGTGYVAGHSTGRWCREALFFLVWSCRQPVLAANLCELAGISES